jgi:hypothetical protein
VARFLHVHGPAEAALRDFSQLQVRELVVIPERPKPNKALASFAHLDLSLQKVKRGLS